MIPWARSSPFRAWVLLLFFALMEKLVEGLFVLIQIAVTSIAVIAVLLIDKFKSALWAVSKRQEQTI